VQVTPATVTANTFTTPHVYIGSEAYPARNGDTLEIAALVATAQTTINNVPINDYAEGTAFDLSDLSNATVSPLRQLTVNRPTTTTITGPTQPACSGPGNSLHWRQIVHLNMLEGDGGAPLVGTRLLEGGITQRSIELDSLFGSGSTVEVTAVAWDGYMTRSEATDQPNERFKLVFLKQGAFVAETNWTGPHVGDDGLATGTISAEWSGALGATYLPNGADQALIVHWSDPQYGTNDDTSWNSVVPTDICIKSLS